MATKAKFIINGNEIELETFQIPQEIVDKVDIELYDSKEAAQEASEELKSMMCNCKTDDIHENTTYFADFKHPELDKHHWRHDTCGKIVQIG